VHALHAAATRSRCDASPVRRRSPHRRTRWATTRMPSSTRHCARCSNRDR
jgi:hypothetical protein